MRARSIVAALLRVAALLLVAAVLAAVVGCGQSPPAALAIEDWCLAIETAMRERHQRCACDGPAPSDDAIALRCAALPATSLLDAFSGESVGWHGTIAAAHVRRLDGCEPIGTFALGADDPVLGSVAIGEPCRVFDDAWGAPDDCAYGARCVPHAGERRCVAIAREGEPCGEEASCEVELACVAGSCACAGDACAEGVTCPPLD